MGQSQNEKNRMILTLNVGSSSLKYALYDEELRALEEDTLPMEEESIFTLLKKLPPLKAIGHRIVHGGDEFDQPTRITDAVIQKLEKLIPFSPLHLPIELDVVKKLQKEKILQVACFDTSFHRAMPLLHQHFPLPLSLWNEGIKKYGFHGISYEYILDYLGNEAEGKKIVIAHLGSGASMVGIDDGKPIDTTMGLTPTGGIMMSTRSGDLDPGILTYLIREKEYNAEKLDALLNHKSGLLGISDQSSDMKKLLELAKTDEKAKMAITLFCYIARKAIGSLAAALGGLDILIFTGGIGEKSKEIRIEICEELDFLKAYEKMRVIPTNENLMIAKHTKKLLETIT